MNKAKFVNTRNPSSGRKKENSFASSSNFRSFSCRSPGFSDRNSVINEIKEEDESIQIKIPTPYPKSVNSGIIF
jgi:hypothetical protein